MHVLFIHRHFPGQFHYVAPLLAERYGWRVTSMTVDGQVEPAKVSANHEALRRRLGCGFTLVELLVVIGIVTVLIALLLPALGRVREHANRVKCAANLRSIGQALTMYTQQYGYYPGCEASAGAPGRFAVWPVRLREFMGGNQDAFYCPSQDERCRWVKKAVPLSAADAATPFQAAFGYQVGEPVLWSQRTPFSYGYNFRGVRWQRLQGGLGELVNSPNYLNTDSWPAPELKASRVKSPSQMIAIADAPGDGHWDVRIDPVDEWAFPGKTHSAGANVLYCDGHVQWDRQENLALVNSVTTAVEARRWSNIARRWNNDNWGPDDGYLR